MSALWPHQQEAIDWIGSRSGSMLDIGMGGGKSRVIVESVMQYDMERVLIACPKAVVDAWLTQFARFYTDVRPCHVLLLGRRIKLWRSDTGEVTPIGGSTVTSEKKTAALERSLRKQGMNRLVVVTNYESPTPKNKFGRLLLNTSWDAMVADEIHRIKSPFGKRSRFMHTLGQRASTRIGLTGTMMPNSPVDVFAQYRFLDDEVFGRSFVRWRYMYCRLGGYGGKEVVGYQNEGHLRDKLAEIRFHVSGEELDKTLGLLDPIHTKVPVTLGPEASKIYEGLSKDLVVQVQGGEIDASNALVKLLRLQQITGGHAAITSEDADTIDEYGEPITSRELVHVDDSKKQALVELLEDAGDEPFVVFAWFTGDLDQIHAAAEAVGCTSGELSGRKNELAEWQAGKTRVLAVQVQAGSEGVDATRAKYCVFYSTGFSLGLYEQAVKRLHRPGQAGVVRYYHLIASGTVDERVYKALSTKKKVVETILDQAGKEGTL